MPTSNEELREYNIIDLQGSSDAGKVPFSLCSSHFEIWPDGQEMRYCGAVKRNIPIRLRRKGVSGMDTRMNIRRTGAKRVVGPLELLARGVVLTLGSDALEVIRVVLEAATTHAGYWKHVEEDVTGLPVPGLVLVGEPGW